jgi:RNA polymerase sigma-70 factor (ECF subfamily)
MTSIPPPSDGLRRVQQLFIEHSAEIRGFVAALMPDASLVDDVVQETFMAVSSRAADYDESRSFLAWAFGFGRNKVMEAARRTRRSARPLADEVLEALVCTDTAEADLSLTPLRLRHLEACIDELAPQARRIVECCYQRAMKPAEVAGVIGWAPASVHVALSRARSMIRLCLEAKIAASGESP